MATLELRNLNHRYRDEYGEFVIENLGITWADGSANALLGPSGCGKTTLLNVVSGLLRPKGGQVLFDGKDVTNLSPRERRIAQVFQFPVVYDGMRVYDNLAFPLRNRGVASATIRKRVGIVAELLGLTSVLKRRSRQLTAAEKQKVSLGRGIVREDTAAVLLDEPLTVIDPHHKRDLRRSLREVQRNLGLTMIYVTHDQHEALTFADHITVMRDGKILQTADPQTLHDDPATPFVGYFIGSPGMNLLDARRDAGGIAVGAHRLLADPELNARLRDVSHPFTLGIRPEFVTVTAAERPGALPCSVRFIEDTGAYKILDLQTGDVRLRARVAESERVNEGDRVWAALPAKHLKVFSK